MKFGVWIPNCRHLATPDIIRTTAVRAEQLGYDSVWVSDHVVVPNANVANFGEAIFDPFITLALAAGATSRVKLGTTVLIVPYRNAIVTAKMVSSLDALSGGRVILGIGAGWVAAESAMLGVPFDERGAMTDEHLRAMQELWTSAAPAFAGIHAVQRAQFEPKPVRNHPSGWAGTARPRCDGRWPSARRGTHQSAAGRASGRPRGAGAPRSGGRTGHRAGHHAAGGVRVLRRGQAVPISAHVGRVMAGEPSALIVRSRDCRLRRRASYWSSCPGWPGARRRWTCIRGAAAF
jgi:hypothetical protein